VRSLGDFAKVTTMVSCRNAHVWGVAEAEPGKKAEVVTAKLAGHRDPGYWETSRMLLESALCLALQVCTSLSTHLIAGLRSTPHGHAVVHEISGA
jgi:hypothetical protein